MFSCSAVMLALLGDEGHTQHESQPFCNLYASSPT